MKLVKDNHYVICLNFKFQQYYIIWISNDVDEVLTDDNRKVVAFKTESGMLEYWREKIKEANINITHYDVYLLQQWLLLPGKEFNRIMFLNLWNLFTDVAESVKERFLGDEKNEVRNSVYDKLFDASGIFITDDPDPVFDMAEIVEMSKVMQNGLDILLNNVSVIDGQVN